MKKLVFILLFLYTLPAVSDPIKPDSIVIGLMERGKDMLVIEEYSRANNYFMQCLNQGTILPNELAFYFGKSLFNSKYPRQSEMFLMKYISLKDTTAANYGEALTLLELLRAKPKLSKEEVKKKRKHDHSDEANDPCEGYDEVVCPVCNGSGVLKQNGKFGPIFRTCQYCNDHGLMPCDDFIKYREGTLFSE